MVVPKAVGGDSSDLDHGGLGRSSTGSHCLDPFTAKKPKAFRHQIRSIIIIKNLPSTTIIRGKHSHSQGVFDISSTKA